MPYTIDDIHLGQVFLNPDSLHPDSGVAFTSEVIGLNHNNVKGYTTLRIVHSTRPDHQWFCVGTEFREMSFIDHWNKGLYILQVTANKPRLELCDV